MCNLYSTVKVRPETAKLARALLDIANDRPPMSAVYPDYSAPVVGNAEAGVRKMRDMRLRPPVILKDEKEWDLWLSGAPWDEVEWQRPLSDGSLKVDAWDLRHAPLKATAFLPRLKAWP